MIGGAVLAGLGGAGLFAAWSQAVANAELAGMDEAIRTAPETIPDFSAVQSADEQALIDAVRAPTPPVAIEYAQIAALAARETVTPALKQAEDFVVRNEPQIDFVSRRQPEGRGIRNEVVVALGPEPAIRRPKPVASGRLQSLRERIETPRELERKGRWVLFASDEQNTLGLNLLRGRSGELRRMSWSSDNIAAVGDMQAGIGWRKGAFQASLALVDREVSIYGKSRDERFMAFTISIKPRGARTSRVRDPNVVMPSYYPPKAKPR